MPRPDWTSNLCNILFATVSRSLDYTQIGAGPVVAIRPFNGPLSIGQTFSIDFANGFIADPILPNGPHPGNVSWQLHGPAFDIDSFIFQAAANMKDYFVQGPDHGFDTGIPITTEGVHCELTLLGPGPVSPFPLQYMLQVTPFSPGSNTHTFIGNRIGVPIDSLYLTAGFSGTDPSQVVYFNNISIGNVPEPGTAGLLLAPTGALLARRRRSCRDEKAR